MNWYCNTIASFTWDTANGPVNRTIDQEWQNYANWYSFHRTRSKAAKAGASYAFSDLGNNVRVGFETIWHLYNGSRDGMDIPVERNNGLFEDVAGAPNRSDWFEELFDAQAVNGTPLRPALDEVGEYFEDNDSDGPWGPEDTDDQITCRQNFAILTTDGYWNTGGTSVGNSDNTNGPMHTSPSGFTLQYTPAAPWMDSWDNTLADVAMHYWKNDLRTDMANNVPTNSADPAFWQHMVTFGISIGLQGTLDPADGLPGSWPNPMDTEDNERIDDLWHAAVNGHGEFVAATNPEEFAEGLKAALSSIIERTGSSSTCRSTAPRLAPIHRYSRAASSPQVDGELKAFRRREWR